MLRLGYSGHTSKQTARAMGVTASTVRSQWQAIRERLNVTQRGQAFAVAVRYGWVQGEDGLPVVIFRDRPRALELTDGQRLYLRAFDVMTHDRTEASVEHVAVVRGGLAWETERNGGRMPRAKSSDLDQMFLRLARAIGSRRPAIAAPFGDRSLVTDLPAVA